MIRIDTATAGLLTLIDALFLELVDDTVEIKLLARLDQRIPVLQSVALAEFLKVQELDLEAEDARRALHLKPLFGHLLLDLLASVVEECHERAAVGSWDFLRPGQPLFQFARTTMLAVDGPDSLDALVLDLEKLAGLGHHDIAGPHEFDQQGALLVTNRDVVSLLGSSCQAGLHRQDSQPRHRID